MTLSSSLRFFNLLLLMSLTLDTKSVSAQEVGRESRRPDSSTGSELMTHTPKIGIVLFDQVEVIDFAGPYEVFGQAGFEIFTVSSTGQPLTANMGLRLTPTYSIEDSPIPDVLVVPGGGIPGARKDRKLIAWIKRAASKTDYTLSVCNGAFILGDAGLLEGRSATTYHQQLSDLEAQFPKTRVLWDKRFVDNGRVVTSAGLSAGIDAALYLVHKIRGEVEAKRVALNMEYVWNPTSTWSRAALADMHIPQLPSLRKMVDSMASMEGDERYWSTSYKFREDVRTDDIQAKVIEGLRKAGWKIEAKPRHHAAAWSFKDRFGRRWKGKTQVSEKNKHSYLAIEIRQTDSAM